MDAISIVDLQKAFEAPPELMGKIEERARAFPRRILTKIVNRPDSVFHQKPKRRSCLPGDPGGDFAIAPHPETFVRHDLSA